jgi:hypothetical protein
MAKYGLVEFWKPRDNWYDLTKEQKAAFLDGIRENIATLSAIPSQSPKPRQR